MKRGGIFIKKNSLTNTIIIDSINTIFYREFPCNYIFQGESHDFWELVYMDSGEMTVTADSQKIQLKKDTIIFHKPNEFHAISTSADIAPNVIIISFETNSEIMKNFEDKIFYLNKENKSLLGKFLKEAKSINPLLGTFKDSDFKENIFGSFQSMYITLELLIIDLYRNNCTNILSEVYPDNKKIDSQVIDSIVEYLNDNVCKRITFNDIHKRFFYSATQLKTKFTTQMGVSIIAYFNMLKIKKAKYLIREGQYNFTQISAILGFDSIHYFSKVFKRIAKMTPTEYERSVKSISDR